MYLQKARDVTYETIITENFSKLMKLREHKGELISLSLSLSLSHTHTHTHTHTHYTQVCIQTTENQRQREDLK
jgi:hypothetical protein